MAHTAGRQESKGASTPYEKPDDLQVKSKYVAARHYKTIINMETISVLISFPHSGISCLIIIICLAIMSTGIHNSPIFMVILLRGSTGV